MYDCKACMSFFTCCPCCGVSFCPSCGMKEEDYEDDEVEE